MPIEIRQTIVTPAISGDVVQLHISDAELDDEDATFRLVLRAKLPPLQTPALAHVQREAMKICQDALTPLLQRLARELKDSGLNLNPQIRRPSSDEGEGWEGPDDDA